MHLAVIPARAGSKGLKDKNITPICGKPLYMHTLQAAIWSCIFDKIVVTTDSDAIIHELNSIETHKSVSVLRRPDELATDEVTIAPVIIHALEYYEGREWKHYSTVTTLQPTSPFRTSQHIIEAHKRFEDTKADSLISVCEELHSIWSINKGSVVPIKNPAFNRQWETPFYVGNGAIAITKREILLEYRNRVGGHLQLYPMNSYDALDIHTKQDIELAEFYKKQGWV